MKNKLQEIGFFDIVKEGRSGYLTKRRLLTVRSSKNV